MHKRNAPKKSVFEKFGGIRPMAATLGLAHSTVKAWHYSQSIPSWRHAAILSAAEEAGIPLDLSELTSVAPDSEPLRRGAPIKAAA